MRVTNGEGKFPSPRTPSEGSAGEGRGLLRVYVQGQLSNLHRNTAEAIALSQGTAPRTLQRFLESIKWDEEALRNRCQQIIANRGKVDNCVVGVHLSYAAPGFQVLLDSRQGHLKIAQRFIAGLLSEVPTGQEAASNTALQDFIELGRFVSPTLTCRRLLQACFPAFQRRNVERHRAGAR